MRIRLALVVAASFASTFAPVGFGLGFSDIEVHSALNQPLEAEIRLLAVKPAEREALTVALAGPAMFEHFGLQRPAILDNMRIEVVPGSGGSEMRILLRSDRPVREPFLTFLLEARWSGRRALREYTVLLDPPVTAPAAAEREATPATATETRPDRAPRQQITAAADRPPARAATTRSDSSPRIDLPEPEVSAPARTYGPVAPSETLWSIAYALRPDPSISMNQMLLAIYQANPHAFDDNINLMHRGAVLNIPDADEIRAIDKQVASREVADQKRVYARLRPSPRPARQAGSADAIAEATTAGAQETQPPESGGELRLEPPEETEDEVFVAAAEAELQSAEGEAELQSAEGEAEPPLDETVAALAAMTRGAESVAESEAPETPEEAVSGEAAPTAPAESGAKPDAADDEQPLQAAADVSDAAEATDGEKTGDEKAVQASQPVAVAGGSESGGSSVDAQPGDSGKTATTGSPSMIQAAGRELLDPRWLALALAAVTLVAGLVLFLRRRQYKPMPADLADLQALEENSGNARIEPTADIPAASAPPPEVDELIEDVDSLIENELYDEALDALDLALEHHPDDIRMQRKVIEAYYIAGRRDEFVEKAAAFYPDPGEDDEGWRIVAAWGRQLAPDEERFASVPPPQSAAQIPAEEFEGFESGGADLDRLLDERDGSESEPTFDRVESVDPERLPAFDIDLGQEPEPVDAPSASEPEVADDASFSLEDSIADLDETGGEDPGEGADTGVEMTLAEEDSADTGGEADTSALDETGAPTLETHEADETHEAETADAEEDETPPVLDVDLSDFDFDVQDPEPGKESESAEPAEEPSGRGAQSLDDFDLGNLSLDDGTAGTESTPEEEAPVDKVAETGPAEEETWSSEPEERPEADGSPGEAAGGTESGADAEEVATKLDLARAYIDMGEPSMASSLLEEVRQHGDEDQRREAEDLLSRAG